MLFVNINILFFAVLLAVAVVVGFVVIKVRSNGIPSELRLQTMSSKWRSSYDSANYWDEFYQRDGFHRATLFSDTASSSITFLKTEVSAYYLLCSAMLL